MEYAVIKGALLIIVLISSVMWWHERKNVDKTKEIYVVAITVSLLLLIGLSMYERGMKLQSGTPPGNLD